MTFQVTFDCADPTRLGRFWQEALRYDITPPPPEYATWEEALTAMDVPEDEWNDVYAIVDPTGARPNISFLRVPEGKIAKNRLHLDLNACNDVSTPVDERKKIVEAEVSRLVDLGATVLFRGEVPQHYHATMTDVEGNEFCVR